MARAGDDVAVELEVAAGKKKGGVGGKMGGGYSDHMYCMFQRSRHLVYREDTRQSVSLRVSCVAIKWISSRGDRKQTDPMIQCGVTLVSSKRSITVHNPRRPLHPTNESGNT